jgi:transcription elongation GreA/GreB family factor
MMNLGLSSRKCKELKERQGEMDERIKELEEKLNNLPAPVAPEPAMEIPEGSNIDIAALSGMFASKQKLDELEKTVNGNWETHDD